MSLTSKIRKGFAIGSAFGIGLAASITPVAADSNTVGIEGPGLYIAQRADPGKVTSLLCDTIRDDCQLLVQDRKARSIATGTIEQITNRLFLQVNGEPVMHILWKGIVVSSENKPAETVEVQYTITAKGQPGFAHREEQFSATKADLKKTAQNRPFELVANGPITSYQQGQTYFSTWEFFKIKGIKDGQEVVFKERKFESDPNTGYVQLVDCHIQAGIMKFSGCGRASGVLNYSRNIKMQPTGEDQAAYDKLERLTFEARQEQGKKQFEASPKFAFAGPKEDRQFYARHGYAPQRK